VLAVEKRVTSPLLEPSSIEKIFKVDNHIGFATSGLTADSRTLIDHARGESLSHKFTYDEPMKVESITQSVCDLALRFGEGAEGEEAIMSRPFGVALLIAGADEEGCHLYVDLLISFFFFSFFLFFINILILHFSSQVPR